MAFNKLAALAFLAVHVPALVGAQELYTCNFNSGPLYSDCDAVMASIDWTIGTLPDDPPPIQPGMCAKWTASNYPRCMIQACNHSAEPRPNNAFNGEAFYKVIKSNCERDLAGGEAPIGEITSIIVSNNPDQASVSRAKRAAAEGIVFRMITLAESEELLERAKQAPAYGSLRQRQDPGEWTTIGTSYSVPTTERDQVSQAGSTGTTQQWTTTEGFSVGISSTVEVGGSFFEIFSASVSLTVSAEYTESWSETLSFNPAEKCDSSQRAILYMYPLFDKYVGFYANDPNTVVEWFVPVGPPNNVSWDVECLD